MSPHPLPHLTEGVFLRSVPFDLDRFRFGFFGLRTGDRQDAVLIVGVDLTPVHG